MSSSSVRVTRRLPLVFLSSLALQAVSVTAGTKWDPSLRPRNATSWKAERHSRDLPRKPRLAKRATVQPGQPLHIAPDDAIGGFEIIGESGVNGQQVFLGTATKVYIVDKVENNPLTVNGHPAWAAEYDLETNKVRAMDIMTNSFCAGGSVLGDGRWLNVGGNQAVTTDGVDAPDGTNAYQSYGGGFDNRLLTPGKGSEWDIDTAADMTGRRWYPTLETLEDGRIIIIGGNQWGGFVNDAGNSNPTYEFFPKAAGEAPIQMPLLERTLPANLYPITNLLPTGELIINLNNQAVVFDYKTGKEFELPDFSVVRTYPASAATAMLPMTPENDWLATAIYCGGSELSAADWTSGKALIEVAASTSCERISPEVSGAFEQDDDLPEGRVMGSAILLPNGKMVVVNGANTGCSGYGKDPWAINDSYANSPIVSPVMYDPSAKSGGRWSRKGLQDSTVPRMYHSVATLLPDGSVFITGSNTHPDVTYEEPFPSEYRVERFYPPYYNERRPEPAGLPTQLGYGGDYFNVELTGEDLFGNLGNLKTIKIMVIRTGFSTHAINFGQRAVGLDYTYTVNKDGGATLHVSQLPPNAAIMPPGPSWLFVTVNGVPSVGVQVMCGSGSIEAQTIEEPESLPESSEVAEEPDTDALQTSNDDEDSAGSQSAFAAISAISTIGAAVMGFFV